MRGNDRPLRESASDAPVVSSVDSTSAGVSDGLHCSIRAATAAATGEACDVPPKVEVPFASPVDVIGIPGASTSSSALLSVKQAIVLASALASKHAGQLPPNSDCHVPLAGCRPSEASYVAPTAITPVVQAGAATLFEDPWLPVEANTEMPRALSSATAVATVGQVASQLPV
jgi:hypothetical protein